MKVLIIALAICAVAFATTVEKDKTVEKPVDKPAENKTAPADKPTREARYYLLDSGRVYDRVRDYVVPDVLVSRSRSSYIVDPVVSRSEVLYY